MEGVNYILRLCFEAIFCGTVWTLYSTTLTNSKSQWYYKKLPTRFKIAFYAISILVVLNIFKLLLSLGIAKQINKQLQMIMVSAIALTVLAVAVVVIKANENKQKAIV